MADLRRAAQAALLHFRRFVIPISDRTARARDDRGPRGAVLEYARGQPNLFAAAPDPHRLRGRCPRCGEGHLFKGFLTLRPSCEACGLDYTHFDSADGPAFFVMSIVGLIVVGLALWLEITYEPPIWVHATVALTLSVGLSLILVRPLKGLLVALQFSNRAEEGRFEP